MILKFEGARLILAHNQEAYNDIILKLYKRGNKDPLSYTPDKCQEERR